MSGTLRISPLELRADPLSVAASWPAHRTLLMLHSERVHQRWARWSILAEPDGWFKFEDGRSQLIGHPSPHVSEVQLRHDPLADLQSLLDATHVTDTKRCQGPVPFAGGWIGYLSYDLGRIIEPRAESKRGAIDDRHWPLMQLAYCPRALLFDHVRREWTTVGDAEPLLDDLRSGGTGAEIDDSIAACAVGEMDSDLSQDRYKALVTRIQDYIRAGDIYQTNIAHRMSADVQGSTRALALAAFRRSRPWYGAYLELDDDKHSPDSTRRIISLSPELFLHFDPHTRLVTTRPIKGTRPSHIMRSELWDSAKDAAELHMIVDLMRNDLGRVCDFGTVRVADARSIETHPTVHHGVAEVMGRLRANVSISDLLRATFPGGSVTGAPKIRAMQVIDELEKSRRGPYCGAIGFVSDSGDACFNIAIRSMMITNDRLDYWVGAGIVADSVPEGEYRETLDKAAVLRTLMTADLAMTNQSSVCNDGAPGAALRFAPA